MPYSYANPYACERSFIHALSCVHMHTAYGIRHTAYIKNLSIYLSMRVFTCTRVRHTDTEYGYCTAISIASCSDFCRIRIPSRIGKSRKWHQKQWHIHVIGEHISIHVGQLWNFSASSCNSFTSLWYVPCSSLLRRIGCIHHLCKDLILLAFFFFFICLYRYRIFTKMSSCCNM